VTGVLPVLLGRATPVANWLLGREKTYAGTMLLHADVPAEALRDGVARFRGTIRQLPPVRSRVRRAVRQRVVYEFELTGRSGRRCGFRVRCQGGTYIRKLIHDLGQELGSGAQMLSLRRTQSGPFALGECVTLDDVACAADEPDERREAALRRVVRSVEEVIARVLPSVWVDDGAVHSLCTGYPLAAVGVCWLEPFDAGRQVAVITLKGELVGVGTALMGCQDILGSAAGLAVEMDRVMMAEDVYPKWRGGKA